MNPQPRAVGARLAYRSVPERIHAWVERVLGSPVTAVAEQVGGMSPGCASRLVCADGTRAFVKAVGPELNPGTPELFRREVEVLRVIGDHPLWASLIDAYDEPDGWVGLVIEDIDGTHPDLRDDAAMNALLRATDDLAAVLRERTPEPTDDSLLKGLGQRYLVWADAFDHLDTIPVTVVPAWVRHRGHDLQAHLRSIAQQPMDSLVHWDVRDDNLLQRADGSIVFVDWGQAAIGPAWSDPLLARLARVEHPWFDDSVRSSPALAAAGEDAVTTWLCGFAVFLAYRMQTAVDVNLPHLQGFREREAARFLRAAERRLGLDRPAGVDRVG